MLKNLFKKNTMPEIDNLSIEELESLLEEKKISQYENTKKVIQEKFPKNFLEDAKKIANKIIVKIILKDNDLELSFSIMLFTAYDKNKLVVHINDNFFEKVESNSLLINQFINSTYTRFTRLINSEDYKFVFESDSLKFAVKEYQKLITELEEKIEFWCKETNVEKDIVWNIIESD